MCPPCTPQQAAAVAAAALADTLDAAETASFSRRTLVVRGDYPAPPGWLLVRQRAGTLGQRIGAAFVDTAADRLAALLIGMDTPQVTGALLDACAGLLGNADAVLGTAEDGGWWVLGLRHPGHAALITDVPTSRPDTAARTVAALAAAGLTIARAPTIRDVDTAEDAWAVAGLNPTSRFAAAVRHNVASVAGSPT
jgi:glycosyltransferase A (GT-A) superfamily protein (DUF2064 family)